MQIKITKENIDELITSYIDNQNEDPQTKEQLAKMLENDEILRKKHRSEVLTKNILKSRLKPVDVPEKTYLRVTNSIDSYIGSAGRAGQPLASEALESPSFSEYLKNFFLTPFRIGKLAVPRYAAALFLIAAVLFIGIMVSRGNRTQINPFIASGTDKSVMVQAVDNFHKIQSGEVKPEMHSKDAKEITSYLKRKVNFEPVVPSLNDFDLVGCISNQYEGVNLAHIVYTSGNDIIYIYQTNFNSVKQKKLELPDPVYDKMVQEKYYMCDHVDEANCTLLLWFIDNVLCASVSNIPKSNLYNKFVSIK